MLPRDENQAVLTIHRNKNIFYSTKQTLEFIIYHIEMSQKNRGYFSIVIFNEYFFHMNHSFRYVIPYCCNLYFRVLLKTHICPCLLVKFLLRKSEVVRYAHSEVKFASKFLLTCAARGANFTLAIAKTSLPKATSLAREGKLSC